MNIEKFVVQIPLLTDDDKRMIDRADFPDQVNRAKEFLSQFHLNGRHERRWFSAYSRKQEAEAHHRILSPTNECCYISDTAFCVAQLMLGGKLKVSNHRRMAFIGRQKMNCHVSEPRENQDNGTEPSERREFWEWVISLPSTDSPRGDFIQETRDEYERLSWYPEPDKKWWEACSEKFHQRAGDEVYMIYQRLAKQFLRQQHLK